MAKISFLLLLFFNLSPASMFFDSYNVCIEDFETRGNTFYVKLSLDGNYYTVSGTDHVKNIIPGFEYDPDNNICAPSAHLILGMDATDFNFILGLIGLIFGYVFMFFSIQMFTIVGGKR